MARGRRVTAGAVGVDAAHDAVQRAWDEVESLVDARIISHVADALTLEPGDLAHQITLMHVDVDEDPDIWHDAARTAALLRDPAIAEACIAQLQRICRSYNTTGRALIDGPDDAPFGHDALWDRGSEGSTLWVRLATQWGHQGLTLGEVRAELHALDDEAAALSVSGLRAGRDCAAERLSLSDIDVRTRVRDRVSALFAAQMADGDITGARALVAAFHDSCDESGFAATVRFDDEVHEALERIAAAYAHDGVHEVERPEFIDAVATLSLDALDMYRAPRLVGPVGDAALGVLGPDDLGMGTHGGLDLARWEQVAARILAAPQLVPGSSRMQVVVVDLAPGELDAWRARYEDHPAFAGWSAATRNDGWHTTDLHLLGELAGQVDGTIQRIAVSVHVGSTDDDASARQLTRQIVDELQARDIATPELPRELPVRRASGAYVTPADGPATPCDVLVAPPPCPHQYAAWHRNRPDDALVLCCEHCGGRALAVVPLHRAPGERITDEAAYLKREAVYAALDGRTPPASLSELRAAEPVLSLDLSEHLPHLAAAPAEDLSAALFG